jgi:hypothetical protein
MDGYIKSTYEAPKWAEVSTFIKNTAWNLNLECEIEVDKGWFRENGRYKVSGSVEKLDKFKQLFKEAIRIYENK